MTPFRIKKRNHKGEMVELPIFRIEPTITGVGRLPRMSTGAKSEKIARQMEYALETISVNDRMPDLVEQLRGNTVTLSEIWAAHNKPRDERMKALEALRTRKDDPMLSCVVCRPEIAKADGKRSFEKMTCDCVAWRRIAVQKDRRLREGYAQLADYAPANARLSWLTVSTHLNELYETAEAAGRKPNSVRRSLHRAVCGLLSMKFGKGKMLAIISDAIVPSENDERVIFVDTDTVAKLVDPANSDPTFALAVGFAMTTGIDQTPMQLLTPSSVENGVISVFDTKAPDRMRRFELDPAALHYWRLASAGKKPNERVFRYLRKRWHALRTKIGREDIRWKDLRGVFATYYLAGGGSARQLQLILGHSTMSMTLRYLKRLPVKRDDQGLTDAMKLRRTFLKVESA